MRILLVTDSFPPGCGGSGWSTYELARGLRSRGHTVSVVLVRTGRGARSGGRAYDGLPVIEEAFPAPDVPYVRNYFKNERLHPRLAARLRARIAGGAADIVHGQHVMSGPAAIEAARAAGVPAVCTVRDYWPVCYWSTLIHDPASPSLCPACTRAMMHVCIRPRARALWPLARPLVPYMRGNLRRKRTALARADAVVAVSTALARDLRERAPELSATRLEVIPNPVDLAAVRAPAGPPPIDGPYAVYVGKLAPNKGSAFLVPAVRAARLPWPLVVVGDGPLRARVEADARMAGIDARFLGWRPREEALAVLSHAAFVVFPSYGPESLIRVLLEAGALGVPAAAMDTGGTRDIIEHGVTGLLAATPEELGAHAARLASDPDLRQRLGAAARAHVERTFDAARVAARVEALYGELLDARVRALPRGARR
jgi:glycosyltransferase involved in cell wall biosynthesis